MLEDPTARGAERVMIEIYRRLPGYMGTTLTAVVDRLLAGGAPMLVHCSAGKDRTGFVIAMLLHALDVPEPLDPRGLPRSRHWPGAASHRASLEARLGRFIPLPTSCAPRWTRCSTCARCISMRRSRPRGRSSGRSGGISKSPRVWMRRGSSGCGNGCSGSRPSRRCWPQGTFLSAGGFHVPSTIDGGVSVGQYMRIVTLNSPAGAGSQFASLSVPGEAFWM